jgi:TolB-like protein
MSRPGEDGGPNLGADGKPDEAKVTSQCPKCGTKMPATSHLSDRCPVCQLRGALEPETEADLEEELIPPEVRPPAIRPPEVERSVSTGKYDHYELLPGEDGRPIELGRGAMGVTYKAFDSNLRCPVALKVINARYLDSEAARMRFVREARSAARIRHPNVASVFHLGTRGRDYFYAMEFVEGETLDYFIKRHGRFNLTLALDVAGQVASALGAAHKEQIVHRDIKPANLMINFPTERSVQVKVIDFGLARATAGSDSEAFLSKPGTFAGTALFASPEQCAGEEVDVRSDIYSLGVTLWEMLTGNVPFTGTTAEVIRQHLSAPLPLDRLDHMPKAVVALLQSMLEKDPGKRPQDPFVLQSELDAVKKELRIADMQRSLALHGAVQSRRRSFLSGNRWTALTLCTAILVAALVAGVYYWRSGPPAFSASEKSIAVLPFDNVSDNKENEYFSDGLTSEVIYELSKVADLLVIARSSVLQYKEASAVHRKTLNQIGAELGVGAILESTVQRVGNRVKIVTILYDARSNRRLWGASYDRDINDLFAIQSDLSEQIAAALRATLTADDKTDLQRRPTSDPNVYDLYLQGLSLVEGDRPNDNDKAVELFKQASEQDPKFVLAYIGLADAYIERVRRFHGADSLLDSAIELCQRAIALDPKQLRAYTGLAAAFNLKGWFDRMNWAVTNALKLAPNDWDANRMAAAESTEFRREGEMYSSIRKCFLTNPQDSWAPYELALICWTVDEQDLADKWMQRAINLEPDPQKRRLMECERLVYQGDYAAALPALRQLPPDLKTHYAVAADLTLFCSMQVGEWPAVMRAAGNKLKTESDNPTALLRLALAQHASGQEAEARATAEHVVAAAGQKLPTAKSPRWMRFDLAVGSRLLNRFEDAYRHLHDLLANGGFPDPILGPKDPGLDLFKPDSEYQHILADLNREKEAKRARILQIEKGYATSFLTPI